MSDAVPPPFEDVFGDALFSGADAAGAPPLTSGEIEEALNAGADGHVGQVSVPGFKPRFDGDTSQLPPEACWTLQELITAPHVREESRKYWAALLQHEDVLRSRLSELGLLLEINRDRGYAFTRQAVDPATYSRTLLRAKTLSLAASALALFLYKRYLDASQDPVIETDDMIEHMLSYKPPEETDEARFTGKTRRAIQALVDAHVIRPIPGTERYLIYGVITSLLSAERVEALKARYQAVASGTGDGQPEEPGGDDDDDDDGIAGEAAFSVSVANEEDADETDE